MSLTRRLWFGIIIGAISVVIFGIAVAITTCLSLTTVPPTNEINYLVHILGSVAIALHLVNDVAIAFSLVWHLHKNRTGIARSDALIDDIVRRKYSIPSYAMTPFSCFAFSYDPDRIPNSNRCHRAFDNEFRLHGMCLSTCQCSWLTNPR